MKAEWLFGGEWCVDVTGAVQDGGMAIQLSIPPELLVAQTEARRVQMLGELQADRRAGLGQFFTPAPVAGLLADMFDPADGTVRLLDAGAGVGSLSAAIIARAGTERWPACLDLHAVEVDEVVLPALKATLHECELTLSGLTTKVHAVDFIEWGCGRLGLDLFAEEFAPKFDLAILNPPYRKLNTDSLERWRLAQAGIEATNLYAAFVALALRLLRPGGQLVAITPRSFCNGPYFKAFRRDVLTSAAIRRIHLFESRDKAFRDSQVLQENVIFHLVRDVEQGEVVIATSGGGDVESIIERTVPFSSVVHPDDPNQFIHVVVEEAQSSVATRMASLASDLGGIEAAVSTGRVVDFRSREYLRMEPSGDTVPLLYPLHLREGSVRWPLPNGKKPNALVAVKATERLLLPRGNYVLVKRFSSKEERRRVVATVLDADALASEQVAIENHINVYHHHNAGLSLDLAWGIAAYLNSTIVDVFFRQFNGHTQVNATDLRSLRYPSPLQLIALGAAARVAERSQDVTDSLVYGLVPELSAA